MKQSLKNARDAGQIIGTHDVSVYSSADVILVSTNCDLVEFDSERPEVGLENFLDGIRTIASHMREDALLIIESTVPPGTCSKKIYPEIKAYIFHINPKYNDANWLGFRLIECLPIELDDKADLISMQEPLDRLERILHIIKRIYPDELNVLN